MSSDVAIRIEGLAKSYRITHQEQQITLVEQALQRLRHPLHRAPAETFWALSGVDLEIKRGEVLGMIGRNGAGKSTLLKVLARITPPTRGRVDIYGRVGSLLEVGTGFHPELTGRENVYLNGSILGMKKREIDHHFDAIIDFAGVEQFLDTPVKRYSSGMYVRLAFAVAAHLDTEILLVDEVLAVGDQEFQDKCLGKMRDVTSAGRTVILVSHNLSSVRWLAERCVLLDRGVVVAAGETDDVLDAYDGLFAPSAAWTPETASTGATKAARFARVELVGTSRIGCGHPIILDVEVVLNSESVTQLYLGAVLNSKGSAVGTSADILELESPGPQRCLARLSLSSRELAPGRYTVSLAAGALGERQPPHADDVVADAVGVDLSPGPQSSWHLRNWQAVWGSLWLQSEASLLKAVEKRP